MKNKLESKPDINLEVPAELTYLPAVGHFAKAIFSRFPGLQKREDQLAYNLELILYEACANVIRHAYKDKNGSLLLKIWLSSEKVRMEVIDYGPGFDPDAIPVPDFENPQEKGMGLYIIKTAVDFFHYGYSEQEAGNVLHLEKMLG